MIIIRTAEALASAIILPIYHPIERLLLQSGAEFIIVQEEDCVHDIEEAIGFPILTDLDGSHFGDPDFAPAFEWIRWHDPGWWEACLILSDDGPATVLLIPDLPGIDPDMLKMCRTHNLPAD